MFQKKAQYAQLAGAIGVIIFGILLKKCLKHQIYCFR